MNPPTKEIAERCAGALRDAALSRRGFLRSCAAAAVASSLPGCSSGGVEPPVEDPAARLTARPGEPAVEPEIGTTPLGLGGFRDGVLHVPESYDPSVPAPLFIGLHGAGASASQWISYPERSERRGMIFVGVDSRGTTWDLVAEGEYGPDVEFLDRALAHTFERVRVDPARIALGGFADGASYALSLGLWNADLFSHLVAFSPGFVQMPGGNPGPATIFVSHGTDDEVHAPSRSRNTIVPELEERGYEVTFVEFDGGHQVPPDISVQALDWFLGPGG